MNTKVILWGSLGLGAAALIYYLTTRQPATVTQQQAVIPPGGGNNLLPAKNSDPLADTLNTIKAVAGVGSLAATALTAVGEALGLTGTTVATTINAAALTPSIIGSSIETAALTGGATASQAAAAGAAASQAAGTSLAAGSTVTEASTAGSIAGGSVLGMAASVLLPIALVTLAFDLFASDMSEYNKPENLLALNQKTREEEMAKYSVYGSGSTGTNQDPNATTASKTSTGTRFTPGIQGLGSISRPRNEFYHAAVAKLLRKAA